MQGIGLANGRPLDSNPICLQTITNNLGLARALTQEVAQRGLHSEFKEFKFPGSGFPGSDL